MGSRTRRVVLAVLFSAPFWGCCSSITLKPPAVPFRFEMEEPAAPEGPNAPMYVGPGKECPFMEDFCKGQYIYETLEDSHEPSPSGPRSAAGEAGTPAPIA